jgi:hypothetical protein
MGFAMSTGLSWSRYAITEGCCGHGDELLNGENQGILYVKNYQLLTQSLYFEVCLFILLGVLLFSLAVYSELGIYFIPRVCSFVSYVGANLKFPINFSYQLMLIILFSLLLMNYFLK